jgi:hypothetical protein
MQVVGKLFDGPLDIVGDIHGEAEALAALLTQLGYDEQGIHTEGRRLVFVGDLVDRGPDSPAVVEKVMELVNNGVAQCILGNHELNILLGKPKHGNDWFLAPDANSESRDRAVADNRKSDYLGFFSRLPLTLERNDLRIVHACWHQDSIEKLQAAATNGKSLQTTFGEFENAIRFELNRNGTSAAYGQEKQKYGDQIEYRYRAPFEHWPNPVMLDAHAAVGEAEQMGNPIKVLTSGIERKTEAPFPASGKFRFVERVKWWNEYAGNKPVIVGHYWRKYDESQAAIPADAPKDLFEGIEPDQWMGLNHNVYCVDFSVGLAAHNRAKKLPTDGCRLAAVRWPEQVVVFDDGQSKHLVRRAKS